MARAGHWHGGWATGAARRSVEAARRRRVPRRAARPGTGPGRPRQARHAYLRCRGPGHRRGVRPGQTGARGRGPVRLPDHPGVAHQRGQARGHRREMRRQPLVHGRGPGHPGDRRRRPARAFRHQGVAAPPGNRARDHRHAGTGAPVRRHVRRRPLRRSRRLPGHGGAAAADGRRRRGRARTAPGSAAPCAPRAPRAGRRLDSDFSAGRRAFTACRRRAGGLRGAGLRSCYEDFRLPVPGGSAALASHGGRG